MLPTNKKAVKQGQLVIGAGHYLFASRESDNIGNLDAQELYITSDEEIKDVRPHKGKWHLEKENILNKFPDYLTDLSECKLVIMTTDDDLINDGVQAIDGEFLEWFVKNPSCEYVKVEKEHHTEIEEVSYEGDFQNVDYIKYKIIISGEEPKTKCYCGHTTYCDCGVDVDFEIKQETLEQAAEKYSENWEEITGLDYENTVPSEVNKLDFINGAKWQQEQNKNLYSEEDLLKFGAFVRIEDKKEKRLFLIQDYFKKWKQFKKK